MEKRKEELSELKLFTQRIDKDITMILQSLQWNRSKLMENSVKETCSYDSKHKIPTNKKAIHEQECFLSRHGYSKEDRLLPDPVDVNANTLVKFSKDDITKIINKAKSNNPRFKSGPGAQTSEPYTLERLQATYSSDERRAIHDAVVEAVPFCPGDLDLPSMSGEYPEYTATAEKTRAEILAELRDMKRRRTKYRVATKSRNYSFVLRDVIKAQMELYTEVNTAVVKTEPVDEEDDPRTEESTYIEYVNTRGKNRTHKSPHHNYTDDRKDRHNRDRSRHFQEVLKPPKERRPYDHIDRRYESKDTHKPYSSSSSREINDDHMDRQYEYRETQKAYKSSSSREINDDLMDIRYQSRETQKAYKSSSSREINDDHQRVKINDDHQRVKIKKERTSEESIHDRRYDVDNETDRQNKYLDKPSSSSKEFNDDNQRVKIKKERTPEESIHDRRYNVDNERDRQNKYLDKPSSSSRESNDDLMDIRYQSRETQKAYKSSSSREINDDHQRVKIKKERTSEESIHDRKYDVDNDRVRRDKYLDKPSSSKESRGGKHKKRRKAKDKRKSRRHDIKIKEEDEIKSKRTKYS